MSEHPRTTPARGRWQHRREQARITQEELAVRAGLSLRRLKEIEVGQAEPTPKEARALAAVIEQGAARQ